LPNNNKWVVDWGNPQSGVIYKNEFDTEEEAIEWGKEKNKEHNIVIPMSTGTNLTLPITYMHMVYEPMILENDMPPYQDFNEKDDAPAQGIEEGLVEVNKDAPAQDIEEEPIKVNDDAVAQCEEENKVKTIKVYRVEDPKEGHGLWRDFDGSFNPVFNKLTKGKCKDMPMEDSDFYREDGKMWFSATDTPEKLTAWFSALDVVELEKLGYNVYEFEVEEWRSVNEYEVVFTRESIRWVKAIDPVEIWGEEYTNLKGEV